MWVFTVDGFFSAVEAKGGGLMIRARFRSDLEHLIKRGMADKIVDTPQADYPFRVIVTKKAWAKYMADSAMAIDYPNFKGKALARASWDRSERYHRVWADMAEPCKEPERFRY